MTIIDLVQMDAGSFFYMYLMLMLIFVVALYLYLIWVLQIELTAKCMAHSSSNVYSPDV